MDDIIAAENMVFRGVKEKEEDKRDEANGRGGGGGGEERASSFISNLVSAEDGKAEGKDEEKGTAGGGGGGGVIAHLISNLVSPLSSPRDGGELKKRKVDLFDVEIEGRSEDGVSSISPEEDGGGVNGGGGGGGGTISNLISNFFHQSEGEGGEKNEHGKEEVKVVVGESKQVRTEEDGGSGGGIISNLVSHLPTSLPDDAAPAPDEAAILIHSIVRD